MEPSYYSRVDLSYTWHEIKVDQLELFFYFQELYIREYE